MKAAFDTNVLVYAYSLDDRSTVARRLIAEGGSLSVQNLNEFANVAKRKLGFSWQEIEIAIDDILVLLDAPIAVDLDIHRRGLLIAQEAKLSLYDALIVAAALEAGCDILYTEDMHPGLIIDGRLRIVNPFMPAA
jgi:predicted nucleic acid-binding protein